MQRPTDILLEKYKTVHLEDAGDDLVLKKLELQGWANQFGEVYGKQVFEAFRRLSDAYSRIDALAAVNVEDWNKAVEYLKSKDQLTPNQDTTTRIGPDDLWKEALRILEHYQNRI